MACQLDRIADAMAGFDWNAFVATLIATIVGALVAAFIGLAVARMERPQPFFRVETRGLPVGDWYIRDGVARVAFEVTNIGDGPAFNVRVRADGGHGSSRAARVAKLESGESVKAWLPVEASGEYLLNQNTAQYESTQVMTWPAAPGVRIRWQQPPQRHRPRSIRLTLAHPDAPDEDTEL